MANGFKVFSTGEVLTAADVNDYLMEQSIGIFADSSARDSQISSPIEGQFAYLSSGLSGGAAATSGAFSSTLVISPSQATSATVAGSDIVLIGDADDSNNLKRTTAQDIANLAGGVSLGLVLALS